MITHYKSVVIDRQYSASYSTSVLTAIRNHSSVCQHKGRHNGPRKLLLIFVQICHIVVLRFRWETFTMKSACYGIGIPQALMSSAVHKRVLVFGLSFFPVKTNLSTQAKHLQQKATWVRLKKKEKKNCCNRVIISLTFLITLVFTFLATQVIPLAPVPHSPLHWESHSSVPLTAICIPSHVISIPPSVL